MSATHCPNFNFTLLCTFPDQWYIKATVMLVLGALFGPVTFVTKKVTVLMNIVTMVRVRAIMVRCVS